MRADHASRTAEYMALFRAVESARPASRRMFDDPFAERFLEGRLRWAARAARLPGVADALGFVIDRGWPGARSSGVARTRLIDDALRAALSNGISQVVLLGAGFDARAYRLPELRHIRVFEVDHPATLAAKRARLTRAGADLDHVTFAAIDFDKQRLEDVLVHDRSKPAFFLWEGVTNYLTAEAVDGTLRFIAQSAPGSQLLFTYIDRAVLEAPEGFAGTTSVGNVLRDSGEPWTFGLDPATVKDYLAERGLHLLWDLGAADYRARYYGNARLPGYEFYHAVLTEIQRKR